MLEQNKFKRAIRNFISGILAVILILTGRVRRARAASFQKDRILSVFFHNPPQKLFARCMHWLHKRGYHFVTAQDVIDFIVGGKQLPAGSVWVSFDDGWKANLSQVLPVIEALNIPLTLFIPTAEIEKGGFWFCQVFEHQRELPDAYQSHPFESLLTAPNQTRQQLVDPLYPESGADYILSKKDVVSLSRNPLITLGSHTDNHVVTVRCTETVLEKEIEISKEKLEAWTGKAVTTFAYPNGDHDGREIPYLKKHGYELAATIVEGLIDRDCDPYRVPRNCVLDDGTFAENLCHMLGVWTPFIDGLKRLAGRAPQRSTSSTSP